MIALTGCFLVGFFVSPDGISPFVDKKTTAHVGSVEAHGRAVVVSGRICSVGDLAKVCLRIRNECYDALCYLTFLQ